MKETQTEAQTGVATKPMLAESADASACHQPNPEAYSLNKEKKLINPQRSGEVTAAEEGSHEKYSAFISWGSV